jgi:hypothetical protein
MLNPVSRYDAKAKLVILPSFEKKRAVDYAGPRPMIVTA